MSFDIPAPRPERIVREMVPEGDQENGLPGTRQPYQDAAGYSGDGGKPAASYKRGRPPDVPVPTCSLSFLNADDCRAF